jgi:hypothetical protein
MLNLILAYVFEWKFDFSTIDWKVILAALGFIVALITLVYFQWWRNRKRFSYEVLSNNILISHEHEVREKLEIRFAGEVVRDVRLIVIKLINDGVQPIKPDDFQKPIRIVFPKANVLSVEKEQCNPDNLDIDIDHDNESVSIPPTLFNGNDSIQFKVLVSQYDSMKIDGRLVGISNIGERNRVPGLSGDLVSLVFYLSSLFLLGAYFRQYRNSPNREVLGISFMSLVVAITLVTIVSSKVRRYYRDK